MNRRTKRLLMAMQYGLCIDTEDGHLWLHSVETGQHYVAEEFLAKHGKPYHSKIYGNLEEALDYIEVILESLYPSFKGLEKEFDSRDLANLFCVNEAASQPWVYHVARAGLGVCGCCGVVSGATHGKECHWNEA